MDSGVGVGAVGVKGLLGSFNGLYLPKQAMTRYLNNERLEDLRISISMDDIKMWFGNGGDGPTMYVRGRSMANLFSFV